MEWLAGLFDGEGCVSFVGTKTNYSPMVSISSTDRKMLEEIHETLGIGHIRTQVSCDALVFSSLSDTAKLAKLILPFLYTKRAEVEHMLAFCESRMSKPKYMSHLSLEETEHVIMIGKAKSGKGKRSDNHYLIRAYEWKEYLTGAKEINSVP